MASCYSVGSIIGTKDSFRWRTEIRWMLLFECEGGFNNPTPDNCEVVSPSALITQRRLITQADLPSFSGNRLDAFVAPDSQRQ